MSCNNALTTCHSGHLHDSEMEACYCDTLAEQKKRREIKSFRSQVSYDLGVCEHIVDFEVITNAGQVEVHEVKGPETSVWKLKKKMFEERYSEIPYKVVKNVEKYREKYRLQFQKSLAEKFKYNAKRLKKLRKKLLKKQRNKWKKKHKTGKVKIWVSNI